MLNKKRIVALGKVVLSFSLIVYLLRDGQLSFDVVKNGLSNYYLLSAFLFLTFLQLYLASYRTFLVMNFKSVERDIVKRILSLSWASSFLNCVTPSSIFGDAYRIKKLMDVDKKVRGENTIYATLLSKVLSLVSLLIIAVLFSFLYKDLKTIPPLTKWFFCSLVIFFFVSFFVVSKAISYHSLNLFISSRIRNVKIKNFLRNFKDYIISLRTNNILLKSVGLSILIQLLNCISFIIIVHTITPVEYSKMIGIFYVIPISIIAMLLPISFFGLGVGHLAFAKSLSLVGISFGADVYTIFLALSFIFNFLGVFPFLAFRDKLRYDGAEHKS